MVEVIDWNQTVRKLRYEHARASLALDLALKRGTDAEFNVAVAYKMEVTDRLCAALKKVEDSTPVFIACTFRPYPAGTGEQP